MIDWYNITELPKYNPFMFEIARHTRGEHKSKSALSMKMSVKDISDIEKGIRLPTIEEINKMCKWYNYPESFFQQWLKYKLDLSGCLAKNIPINYMEYPIFKKMNPKFTTIDFVVTPPPKQLAKILELNP